MERKWDRIITERVKSNYCIPRLGTVDDTVHHLGIVQIRRKHRQNTHLIIHCPTSEGVSEASE